MPSSPARSVHRRPVVVLWTWPFSSALRAVRGSVTAPSGSRKPALTTAEAAVPSRGGPQAGGRQRTRFESIAERKLPAPVGRARECSRSAGGICAERLRADVHGASPRPPPSTLSSRSRWIADKAYGWDTVVFPSLRDSPNCANFRQVLNPSPAWGIRESFPA